VEPSYDHGNEPSGSIKCWEVLEYLHNWRFLKKFSVRIIQMSLGLIAQKSTKWQEHVARMEDAIVCKVLVLKSEETFWKA
jgi:hypothetical protein